MFVRTFCKGKEVFVNCNSFRKLFVNKFSLKFITLMQSIDFKRFVFEQGIKQKDLAEYLGLSKGYVSLVISGDRPLSEENLRKLINNPYGWNTSILVDGYNENPENQPEAPTVEQPEEKPMTDRLLFLIESQKKDIETLIQLVKEKDDKINELLDELNARKKDAAPRAGLSSSVNAG